jgi:hypothetical protein
MSVWEQLTAEIQDFTDGVRDLPVLPHVTPSEVKSELESRYDFAAPVS